MSGMGYRGKNTNLPEEVTAVQSASEVETKMGEIPGTIVAFNAEQQTADIQPVYLPLVYDEPTPLPVLKDVPVRFPRTSSSAITLPLNVGDYVTLRPLMRSTDNYHSGGPYVANGDPRYNSIADMEAHIDGGERVTNPLSNYDNVNINIRFNASGSYGIKGNPDGTLLVTAGDTTITTEDLIVNSENITVTSSTSTTIAAQSLALNANQLTMTGSEGELLGILADGFLKLGSESLVNAADYTDIGNKLNNTAS